jgi:hypothetical protein
MKRKTFLSYEKIPAAEGAVCKFCRESFEISLLIPPKSLGGNRRRFKRYYQCENCTRIFSKHDWVYALIFLVSPRRIAEYLFRSPRSRLREIQPQYLEQAGYRGHFRPVDFAGKKAREQNGKGPAAEAGLETSERNQDQQSQHLI